MIAGVVLIENIRRPLGGRYACPPYAICQGYTRLPCGAASSR